MPDIAQLGLSIDTRQVVEGSKALDSLGEAAVRVEQKTVGATAAVDKLGEASALAKTKAAEGATAVDALGDAGARVAPKVAGATTSVDSLSAATARVRSTSTEGVSALDNFTNSSAGVWRRGSDAAKSVEALGDATQRTGQRAAISNGQMDDTSKIMRAQAEQARLAAQATTALGGSTTQLTLGQQQLIERMREQAATIGMSRTQLLAYQAAQMGVTKETQQAIAAIKGYEDAIKAAAKAKEDAAKSSGVLALAVKALVAAYAALKVWDYIKESSLLAARYETLGVVVQVVGRNAGYTKTQMDTATDSIARQGITMVESRESATKLVQAHVDLKNATVLARIAQDAAVIGHLNSSDAFDRLVNGISRGNVLILRNIGINVNLQTAYRQMADELGKTTKELSENERVQARLNAVIERGSDIAGTYEAAMGTAGKQITSMQRYMTDLKTVVGETFLEVLTVTVMALTKGLKDANGEVSELSRNNQLHEWGSTLAQVFVVVADNVNNAFSAMKLLGAAGSYASKASEIHTQYTIDRSAAGFSITGQIDAYKKMQAAMEANAKLLGDSKDQILAGEDKFQKAYDERAVTINVKRKKDADEKLKVDNEYAQRAQSLMAQNAGKSLKIQQDAQIALANSVYVGTPTYRDTEGREPKPKADQVENTQLADQIKQYAKEAATAKAHYDALGKLDDMYLKGGELSVHQAYQNKRDYALKTYEAEIDSFDQQIGALQGHNSATKAEAAKHQKELNEILGKRDAAEKAFFDASFIRDEEERLRQAATATAAADAANKEIASINAQVAAVEEQIRTYGMLPAAKTALAIADLEEQSAALAGFANSEKTLELNDRKIESLKRLRAAQGIAQAQEAGTDVAKAKELLDILTAVDTATKSAAQGMTASFGAVGTAIGGLTTALSGYAVQQQAITAQLAASTKDAHGDPTKIAKAQATAAQQGAQAQIKSYGDMASAAKGFFKENSTGYKVMETAEKAFRAYEMAMAVESMIKKIFFKETEVAANLTLNATKLTGEATTTAASTGLAATEASAWGITAVVKALASLPFPLNLAAGAATLAAVVAIGAKMFGGMGGGSVSLSEQRQAANGTGTVLGDSSAKSESIAHSLAIMEKNSGLGLAHTISMDSSLRKMVAGIGNLSSLLARSGVTGAGGGAAAGVQTGSTSTLGKGGQLALSGAATYGGAILGGSIAGAMTMGTIGGSLTMMGAVAGPIGMAIGAAIGFAVSKLFKTSTSIKDQGITGNAMSLGNVDAFGFTAQAYADINVKKKALGISYSSKNSTQTAPLSDEMNDQFTMIISSMGQTIRNAANVLGLGGDTFNARLNSFVVDLGKISLKDLKGEEQQKALETAFSKMGDDMARWGVAGLQQYQAVGEGYLETLARVANNYVQVTDVLAVLGKSFSTTGLGAVALSEHLIEVSGGIDKLTSGTGYFVQNFLSEAERMAPITKSVNEAMGKLGLAGVKTTDAFKAAVLSAADGVATGKAGAAELYASLLALAEPFKTAADYAAEVAAATGEYAVAAKTASEVATERRDLQQQLNELTKSETALLAIQRAGIADVNKALFDQVQAAKAVVSAKDALSKAYETESAAAKTALEKSKSWVTTLNSLNASMALGGQSILTPEQKYAEARAQFEKTLAAANAGDTTAQSGLSAAEQAFLTASQVVNASDAKYAADYARVIAANQDAAKWAAAQVDMQQASLDALKAQVSGLITINDSVLTVAQAIANLRAAMGTATGLGVQFDGSHAGGLTNVPFDGYAAELHRGEVVVDAQAAAAMRRYFGGAPSQGGGNTDALLAEIKSLREEVKGLRADQDKQTGAAIQATVESNAVAARTVVDGVDKSARAAARVKQVEYSK
ncbi:hypothetical protein FHI69_02895 [Janthinobacterium lividum]|uniref:Bacteriophage tail tape measure N-terminal domain-containing protein n=1 Tax=Janthinobacterium lividum TaxID=29581 RepID=A0A5C4P102_9BURK|nr:hypothetical protein [Janthinobacterium lividum]TNC78259.1 hypothetical protein FHI69_02895 [Janthinobacterium lividum]